MITESRDYVELIVDGKCPVCSAYGRSAVRGDDAVTTRMIDARSSDPRVQEALGAGLDLDDGMVAYSGGKFYHGGRCLRVYGIPEPISRSYGVRRPNNVLAQFFQQIFLSGFKVGTQLALATFESPEYSERAVDRASLA